MTSNKYTNKLIHEKSPYLLQHAHNPVKWYPWGDKAFEEAQKRQCPIFLSVGYSTCHWCHDKKRYHHGQDKKNDESGARGLK